ncbi:hypothetical protein L21SP5_03121 [Salinivirga cyanobacteriivorans]|uniref:STAS domain-containing protein n=1 Tax=Salinivirga cyanobacteriivorans TaxID=1307839 RepID=A0A0S2I3A3_9BACT|nr:hypothetical protein [Salinivirga cyanobacteriivorans]ALO16736.1 hypothetical protein L21SP5_03121 [Salinivirga cyanobacteriivorans]
MKDNNLNIRRTKNQMVIKIDNPADIQHIQKLHADLKGVKFDRPEIVFEVEENMPIDLSFIQVIIALKESHLEKNQKITLKAPLDDTQKNVILDTNKEINIAT